MKIQFDSNQQYQLDAIQAMVEIFDGQPLALGEYEIRFDAAGGDMVTQLGVGNNLVLDEATILANLRRVQERNEIKPVSETLDGMHFTTEMETGTGKTYVYLRTIHELNKIYGFKKFVIVVPSVAIREGVLKNIELTREHFQAIYGNVPVDYWVYDSKQVSRLRGYANSNQLQILIINIDAFNKPANNVIHQENDKLSGRKPIEFLEATNPIVVVDEPQNMESDQAKAAVDRLNPLCTLRYSATHRNLYNQVYRLDPVTAYDLKLVKRIEVDAILDDPDFNRPYIEVKSVKATKTKITARLIIDVDTPSGPKRKTLSISRNGTDLHDKSNERGGYKGYIVNEINAGAEFVAFGNGVTLHAGQTHGGHGDDVMKAQIRETIKEHFDKELRIRRSVVKGQRMKVLSLFFIDRVTNYWPEDGKIRRWFTEAYQTVATDPQYKPLNPPPVDEVHNGYFAQTSKGAAKDTKGNTKADDAAYELIMKDKERLLDQGEPLRFIFSHSALREGWDNPNVFQICTLNETKSEIKKRQEIGRGLRLPVREDGTRCFDPNINRLTIIANDMYDDFARTLQTEIEEECGVEFEDRISNKRERRTAKLVPGWRLNPDFQALWGKIQHKTRYSVRFETADLIAKAAEAVKRMPPIVTPKMTALKSRMTITDEGVTGELLAAKQIEMEESDRKTIPDILGYLQRETELTRSTLADILIASGRLGDVAVNPQQFMDYAASAIRHTLHTMIIDGIQYEKVDGQVYEMFLFEDEIDGYLSRMVDVDNSIYDCIEYDSEVERRFAETMSHREDIRLFIKLPDWFKVETPIGTYNPDWAIVKQEDSKIYLVRETKSTKKQLRLRGSEWAKIRCGKAHFDALDVDFEHVVSAEEV